MTELTVIPWFHGEPVTLQALKGTELFVPRERVDAVLAADKRKEGS